MGKTVSLIFSIIFIMFTALGCSQADLAPTLDNVNSKVVDANTQFALKFFQRLNEEEERANIFISPLSLSSALTMTYNGAMSTTKEAMAQTLGFQGLAPEEVNKGYGSLSKYLLKMDKEIQLDMANSIWVREGQKINDNFITTNQKHFQAQVETLDFSHNQAVETINQWVAEATKGKISKVLEPPINPNVIMYLINAIYFKGNWSEPFDPNLTYDGVFKTYQGQEQTVKMMRRQGMVAYGQGEDYQAVKLPYGQGKVAMYCILPDMEVDLNQFIAQLNQEKWEKIRTQLGKKEEVILEIPKFNLEYGIKSFKEPLKSMGMEEAFSRQADFSGIREGIFISDVFQKALIEVNEAGSEAAATTVVEMRETAYRPLENFTVDRPFMFIIAEEITGTILFMGKVLHIE